MRMGEKSSSRKKQNQDKKLQRRRFSCENIIKGTNEISLELLQLLRTCNEQNPINQWKLSKENNVFPWGRGRREKLT